MGYSQKELARKFENGHSTGKASAVSISEIGTHGTFLMGYGWAIYAFRRSRDGEVFLYPDWHGYSNTTSKHITQLKRRLSGYETGDGRPNKKMGSLKTAGNDELEELL